MTGGNCLLHSTSTSTCNFLFVYENELIQCSSFPFFKNMSLGLGGFIGGFHNLHKHCLHGIKCFILLNSVWGQTNKTIYKINVLLPLCMLLEGCTYFEMWDWSNMRFEMVTLLRCEIDPLKKMHLRKNKFYFRDLKKTFIFHFRDLRLIHYLIWILILRMAVNFLR